MKTFLKTCKFQVVHFFIVSMLQDKLKEQLLTLRSDCVTPEELNRVKLEFQSLHELLHQSRSQEKESEVQLTSKEIEHRMVDLLQGYVTKEEWSKTILTMASKDDVNKSISHHFLVTSFQLFYNLSIQLNKNFVYF